MLALEDQFDIVKIVEQYLQKLRFIICTFTHPIVTLEHFKSNFQDYRMVVSDIRMPRARFAKKVKGIKPEVKIILMTVFALNHPLTSLRWLMLV
jgi:two-component SAPR family response regulator